MKHFSFLMALGAWALAASPARAEEPLGRLFFTPEQRARMDVARQQERNVRIDEEDSAPQSASLHLNGVITRSDGKSTVWINNRIQNNGSPAATVGKGGEVRVATPDAKKPVRLKVGQSFDMSSGQVEEAYLRPSPVPAAGKEAPPPAATPKPPVPPSRQDDMHGDVAGEPPPPR